MRKDKTTLALIVSILISLLLLSFLVSLFKVIQNKNRYTSNILTTLSNKIIYRNNAEILTQKYSELKSTSKTINNYFIEPDKINVFITYLEDLGSSNNTKLTVKTANIIKDPKNMISITVSINGDFNHVIRVIYLLENSPFYINLNKAFVNKDIKTNNTNTINTQNNIITQTTSKDNISTWQADVSFDVLSLSQ